MSDFIDSILEEDELEKILSEVDGTEISSDNGEEASDWSIEDIDKLISGEMPSGKQEDEIDTSLFSIRPIVEESEKPEMQDVISDDGNIEGQESFFDEPEEFDLGLFEFETVELPEESKEEPVSKYTQKPAPVEPLPPTIEPEKVETEKEEEITVDDILASIDELIGEKKEPAAEEKAETEEEPAKETEEESVKEAEEDVKIFEEKAEENKEEKAEEKQEETADEEPVIDYKTRFFTRLNIKDTVEDDPIPEGPVDKPGFVVRKNEEEGEEDLENVPQIVAAEDVEKHQEEKTKIVKKATTEAPAVEEDDNVDGQIVFNGFEDVKGESTPEKSDESDVENNLIKRRKQKAKIFKVEGIDDEGFGEGFDEIEAEEEKLAAENSENEEENEEETFEEDTPVYNEYTDPSQRNSLYDKLGRKVEKAKKALISTSVISGILFLIAVLPPIFEKFSIESELFTRESMILCVAQAILLIAAVALDSERFFDSLTGLFKGKITGSTAVSLSLAVALVENTVSAVKVAELPVFSAVAVMGVLVLKASDYINAKRIYGNFSICAFNYEHNMAAVHNFDNEAEIFELGRGLLMGNAEIYYSSGVTFPTDFVKKSKEEYEDNKYNMIALIVSAVLSLIAAIIVPFATDTNFLIALSAFAGFFCLSAPITSTFIPALISRIANHKLNSEGTMIVSLNEAEKVSSANAVVIDSADIFDREKCTMHGMKNFDSLRMDAVLLYASAMIIKSGGPLKECFEEVIDGRQDLLPPVRELVYEDKMGISARIYDQKVLLGNRNMLIQHNIKAPEKELEKKYSHDGRKVIYLACNEKLAAIFVVSYTVDDNMRAQLKKLEKSGIQILVRTNDVNVTEELISRSFGLSQDNFKILSSVAGRLYKRRKDTVTEELPTGIIHDGTAGSMIRAVASACSMANGIKMSRILRAVLSVLAFVLGVVVACTGEAGLTGAVASLMMILEIALTSGVIYLTNR